MLDLTALNKILRLLVRKLHPDLNPGQSDYEKELFLRVQAAYDLCDLNSLNEIILLMNNEGSGAKTECISPFHLQRQAS